MRPHSLFFRWALPFSSKSFGRPPTIVMAAVLVASGFGANFVVTRSTFARTHFRSKPHRVVLLIDSDDEKIMDHAISYSMNLTRSYKAKNEAVSIEVVANGAGIKLLRADTSPLAQPLSALHRAFPQIVFSMCDSSRRIAENREGHAIAPIPEARLVPFGIGRVADLEEAGWVYIHG